MKAPLFPLHGFLLRGADDQTAFEAVLATLETVESRIHLAELTLGGRSLPFQLSREALDAAFQQPEARFGGLRFPLGELAMLSYFRDRAFAPRQYDTITLQLAGAPQGLSTAAEVVSLFGAMAVAFGATMGGLYHPDQKTIALHQALAGDSGGIIAPPGAQTQQATPPAGVTREQLEALSAAVHPRAFDRALVPETVWWVSYYGDAAIDAVGPHALDTAEWLERRPLPGGNLLVACEQPPRLSDVAGLDRVAEIARHLRLHELQTSAKGP